MTYAEVFETVGKIAGLGGLCVGLVLFVFRDLIARVVFPRLSVEYAYKTIRLFIVATSVIAIVGMLLWAAGPIIIGSNNQIYR